MKKQGGMKEFIRKTIVSLKRKPQTIPLLVLALAFLVYSLNLTHISDTTAKIQLSGIAAVSERRETESQIVLTITIPK